MCRQNLSDDVAGEVPPPHILLVLMRLRHPALVRGQLPNLATPSIRTTAQASCSAKGPDPGVLGLLLAFRTNQVSG